MVRAIRVGILLALIAVLMPAPAGAADVDVSFEVVRETPVSVTIRATVHGAESPVEAQVRLDGLSIPVEMVRGIRVNRIDRKADYVHIPEYETVRVPITEEIARLESEISALAEEDDVGVLQVKESTVSSLEEEKSEADELQAQLEELQAQQQLGAEYVEKQEIVGHTYSLRLKEQAVPVATCSPGQSVLLAPQSWQPIPPAKLASDTELSLPTTTVNWGEDTAVYEYTIDTGLVQRDDGGWGSKGILVLTINGQDYYDDTNSSWWDTDWPYRMKLTIDNSASTEDLADFPLMVKLTPERFDYNFCQTDGDDIRFVDSDGTALDYEVDTWDFGGDSYFWVRVPEIPAGSTTDYIWLYWGTAGVASGENAEAVWDANYKAVYHMNDNPDNSHIKDSTVYGNDGTKKGTNEPNEATGQVAAAQVFDGTDDYIGCVNPGSFTEVTVEVLMKQVATDSEYKGLVTKWEWASGDNRCYEVLMYPDDRFAFSLSNDGSDGTVVLSPVSATLQRWYYVAGTLEGIVATLYVDGTSVKSETHEGGIFSADVIVVLGAMNAGLSKPFNGIIDEVRISNTPRSAEWIEATYKSMWDSMLTYGDAEGCLPPEPIEPPLSPVAIGEAMLCVAVSFAAIRYRHPTLYVAAFILLLFLGIAIVEDALVLSITVLLFAGYMMYALMQWFYETTRRLVR